MSTRIEKRFAALKADGRAALVTFTMAGDPDTATSLEVIKALPKAGADMIEIGMPFTDPMADGPAIQAAGVRALAAGQTLAKVFELAPAKPKDHLMVVNVSGRGDKDLDSVEAWLKAHA